MADFVKAATTTEIEPGQARQVEVKGKRIALFNVGGQFFALDASTGQVLWLDRPRQATNTALVKADDLLFLLNDDAELIVARSSRTGFEPFKRYRVADSATWAQPAISGKRIFIKDVSFLALWSLD